MAAEVSDELLLLPAEGSLYWDYLHTTPIGAQMQVNLSPEPPGALGADEEQPLIFTVTRVAEHEHLVASTVGGGG